MPRPKNSKNKPKFCGVKLSDLCQYLKPDMVIPVSREFAMGLLQDHVKLEDIHNPTIKKPEQAKIEFTVSNG